MTEVVVATAYGGPEVLSIRQVSTPVPGPGEVRIAVRAAGTNPIDYKTYSGSLGDDPADLPKRLGVEAAGVITAVGPGAIGAAGLVRVGDEVIAHPVSGAYATDLVVPAANTVPKPAGLAWDQAGGLLLAGMTAAHALAAVRAAAGETVLVHGASGGVGLLTVQLAVARGATVLATARATNHGLLRTLGAYPLIYGPGLSTRVRVAAPGGIAAAVDLVGTDEALDVSRLLVADADRIVSIAAFGRGVKAIGVRPGADSGAAIRSAARQQLPQKAAAGRLQVYVTRTYPLREAAAAHRELMTGHATGKIVLLI
jgi:NADPH:quinone reductase-like Zn-dependent oxidoreductase